MTQSIPKRTSILKRTRWKKFPTEENQTIKWTPMNHFNYFCICFWIIVHFTGTHLSVFGSIEHSLLPSQPRFHNLHSIVIPKWFIQNESRWLKWISKLQTAHSVPGILESLIFSFYFWLKYERPLHLTSSPNYSWVLRLYLPQPGILIVSSAFRCSPFGLPSLGYT